MAAQLVADPGELTAAAPILKPGLGQKTSSVASLRTLPDLLLISGHGRGPRAVVRCAHAAWVRAVTAPWPVNFSTRASYPPVPEGHDGTPLISRGDGRSRDPQSSRRGNRSR